MKLTEQPGTYPRTFLDFPFVEDLDNLDANFAVLGIPFGMPYHGAPEPNNQSRAPDALRAAPVQEDIDYTKEHYDFDFNDHLFCGQDIRVTFYELQVILACKDGATTCDCHQRTFWHVS